MRFASFDIECTSLDSSFGRLVCICVKFFDEDEVRTYSIKSVKQEKKLLEWFEKQYNEASVVVSWNGKLFDFPYINGRRMHHGMVALEPKKHVDLLYQARKLRGRGAALDRVAKDLRFENQKYEVPAWRWVLAAEGDKESIDEIVTHCEQDVVMTQEAFDLFEPMIVRVTK